METGFFGTSVQSNPIGSPIQGFFGIVIQTRSNSLITVVDERGIGVYGVTVQVEWNQGGAQQDVFLYQANRNYEKVYPEGIPLKVTVSGTGFVTKVENFTIPVNGFVTMRLMLKRLPQSQIIYYQQYHGPL